MASSKAKVGVNSEPSSQKENKGNGTSSAGEAAPNNRMYCLDELETVATVGELQELPHRIVSYMGQSESKLQAWAV